MSVERAWDVIVIGGGLAGLTAGAYLTAGGKRTLVLEYGDVVGGSTHVFRRAGKWEFDVGVHHLGNLGPDGHLPTMLRGLAWTTGSSSFPWTPTASRSTTSPSWTSRRRGAWTATRSA